MNNDLIRITLPNDTLGWFKELRIKKAKDESKLELKYEENQKVMRELNTERSAARIVAEKNFALTKEIDTERDASRIANERCDKLTKENDDMTEKIGIIHKKFQDIKTLLHK